jgi:hypothetical protein
MIFESYGEFTLGFHYSRLTILNSLDFKGNEWGSNYSIEELLEFDFVTVDMVNSFLKLFDKMGDKLAVEFSDLHVQQFDDYYVVGYKRDSVKIPKSFIKWAKDDLINPNGKLNKTRLVESEMQNKANQYYDKYPNISEMPIEDVLIYVEKGCEDKLRDYVTV